MLFLHIYGDNLEDKMGHFWFLIFYLSAGIFANFAQFAADPFSNVPVIGASGAVAAVMGGYLLLFPKARIDILFIFIIIFKIIPVRAWVVLGIWFVLQLYNGLAVPASVSSVAYWAHIGGFIFGVIATFTTWQKLGGKKFWSKNHGAPDHKEATYSFTRSNIPKVRR
jgi:membrane associated rhomboid family serine protease